MYIYNTDKLQIYFGDASDGISKSLHCIPTNKKLVDLEPFQSVAQKIDVPRLSMLNQTHGIDGTIINEIDSSFNNDGDYLITQHSHVGLGVLTADCVPVILYDARNHIIAAIHAGWRGTVAEIAPKAFEHMKSIGGSKTQNIQLFIGPSAKACCYQVQEEFIYNIPLAHRNQVMREKNAQWYFSVVDLITLQMKKAGISPASINTQFNLCTMCNSRFFSHRRQGAQAGRQITIAALK
jgi:polyphenol oxidase